MTDPDDLGPLRRVPYHIGLASRDFAAGTRLLSSLYGCRWETTRDAEAVPFVTPQGPVLVNATIAHSLGGPMRVEVCCGTLWPTTATIEFHHFGYWSADIARDAKDLERHGWTREVSMVDDSGRPIEFAYLAKEGRPRIELVDLRRLDEYRRRVQADVPSQI